MPNESYITGLRAVKNGKKSQCLNLSNARIKTYAQIQEMTEEQLAGVIICPDYPLEEGDFLPASRVLYDQETTVDEKIDELNAEFTNLLTGTITAGNTSLTISNTKITTSSIIDIYFENKVLAPTNVTVTTGQIVIEIDEQDSDTNVGVRCL